MTSQKPNAHSRTEPRRAAQSRDDKSMRMSNDKLLPSAQLYY